MSARRKPAPLPGEDALAGLSDAQAILAAQKAIVRETALRAAAPIDSSPVRNLVRAAHGVTQLAASCGGGTLYNVATAQLADVERKIANVPSGCREDLTVKLALLVSDLRRLPEAALPFQLALSALLDVVLLSGGEATLPPGAIDPVVDRIDAERWCKRGEALGP